ncbi:DinB family protein [Lysinibacillus sp. BW-2-10]|uniref:DinB family protein n=1 Tax=Lysinibacillus sp. BW-2-10 TaxID=2590030 RepID=UPI00118040FD|nr:DinB family protein [Lysinibacillus sp. BW-2-10]TSI02263.1 DinB family protein [Lysinibacillus sp. BW-2-10]
MENNGKIREAIWESVNGLTDDQLNQVLEEGIWSIVQVLEHLYLMEQLVVDGIQKKLKEGEDKIVKLRPIHRTVDRSIKVQAPQSLVPTNNFQTIEQLKNKLSQSRKSLLTLLDSVNEEVLVKKAMHHPVFGELSLVQWISFVGFHEQRHLSQIEEIKELLK